jgi:hypothetical protein
LLLGSTSPGAILHSVASSSESLLRIGALGKVSFELHHRRGIFGIVLLLFVSVQKQFFRSCSVVVLVAESNEIVLTIWVDVW